MKTGRVSSLPDKGIPDMTCISDIDEQGINKNLKVRYERDEIYVSFLNNHKISIFFLKIDQYIILTIIRTSYTIMSKLPRFQALLRLSADRHVIVIS
uniref:CSON003283 protein n=1 Tax=Culicoides sonorensis TaxID=179676 RepID=A0A336ML00_CULSO